MSSRPIPRAHRAPRIRGRLLQRLRAEHLSVNPLCVECSRAGRVTLATQIDHVLALAHGGRDTRDAFDNRQALCDACHKDKTAKEFGKFRRQPVGLDGWPAG